MSRGGIYQPPDSNLAYGHKVSNRGHGIVATEQQRTPRLLPLSRPLSTAPCQQPPVNSPCAAPLRGPSDFSGVFRLSDLCLAGIIGGFCSLSGSRCSHETSSPRRRNWQCLRSPGPELSRSPGGRSISICMAFAQQSVISVGMYAAEIGMFASAPLFFSPS